MLARIAKQTGVTPVRRVRGAHDLRALVRRIPRDTQVRGTAVGHAG